MPFPNNLCLNDTTFPEKAKPYNPTGLSQQAPALPQEER